MAILSWRTSYHTSGIKTINVIEEDSLEEKDDCLRQVQAGFRKGRGTRDQMANICRIIKKAREFPKNIYFCFIDYAKAFDYVDHRKLWKIFKEMGIPDT